jgi:hypothetical protein
MHVEGWIEGQAALGSGTMFFSILQGILAYRKDSQSMWGAMELLDSSGWKGTRKAFPETTGWISQRSCRISGTGLLEESEDAPAFASKAYPSLLLQGGRACCRAKILYFR